MKTRMNNKKVTLLWPLPPWKWVSQYVTWLVKSLCNYVSVEVLDFSSMYPKKLYPWWNPKQENIDPPSYKNMIHYSLISWRNPISWVRAWFSVNWDVLHMQYWIWFLSPVYIVAWLISKYIKKVPVVITIHNVQPHEIAFWKIWLDKLVYSVGDKFIVHSKDNKTQLEKIIWTKKDITIFPHWIIMPEVEPIHKELARKNLWIWNEKKVLLNFGHIRPYKWLDTMLDALGELLESDKSYILIIAGKCRENRDKYQYIIDKKWLGNNILRIEWFLPHKKVTDVFCASDLLVLPYTHFDAQSWVVALGLWYEIPMIVSDLWWLTEIIDNQYCVIKKWESLSWKIKSLDMELVKIYIDEVKNKFSWETIVKKYIVFYSKICD